MNADPQNYHSLANLTGNCFIFLKDFKCDALIKISLQGAFLSKHLNVSVWEALLFIHLFFNLFIDLL